jgi:hypothetical protein
MTLNDITTIPAERDNLELHVDLCAQRYLLLEKRLATVEAKVDAVHTDMVKSQKSLGTVIITSAGTIVVALLGVIGTVIMTFA